MKYFVTVIWGLFAPSLLWASTPIIFDLSDSGYPPYLIYEKDSPPGGIMFDVTHKILTKHGYRLEPVGLPKKRQEDLMKKGKLDAVPNAKEWVNDPEAYAFTDTIVEARDIVFSNTNTPVLYFEPKDLLKKVVITHIGYHYPTLEPYFKKQQMERQDARTELAMLTMLERGRGDVAILNELVGLWVIKEQQWYGKFLHSTQEIGHFDYRIMFHKKWQSLVDQTFNPELAQLKQSGQFQKIIEKYR